jgi:hypothetical protein
METEKRESSSNLEKGDTSNLEKGDSPNLEKGEHVAVQANPQYA